VAGVEGAPKRLTDEEVGAQLRRILGDAEAWQRRWEAGNLLPEVLPGSSLASDDARSSPYQVSHGIAQTSSTAVDHLHALKVLTLDAQILHNSAPYTLARSTIESAATALWILAPNGRTTRVVRRLIHAAQDARDGSHMITDAGIAMPRPLSQRLAEMDALAKKAGGEPVGKQRLNVTEMLREADTRKVSRMGVLNAWRVCSGFAHGRTWSSMALLQQELHPSSEPDVAKVRLTNRLDAVLWAAWAGHDLVHETLRQYYLRARGPA
jgi:hypothetical protein